MSITDRTIVASAVGTVARCTVVTMISVRCENVFTRISRLQSRNMNSVAATDIFVIPFNVIVVLRASGPSEIINVKYSTAKKFNYVRARTSHVVTRRAWVVF